MTYIHSWRFRVRSYEVDPELRVRPSVYQAYLEEGAVQASAAVGYDYGWYRAHQRVWVARTIIIRIFNPAVYGDELEMRTWVADFKTVQSHRDYELRRAADNVLVLRARTNWVFLNTATMRPERLLPEFSSAFAPVDGLQEIDLRLPGAAPVETSFSFTESRIAQYHEVDSAHHVNNTVYTGWVDQAILNAFRGTAWTPTRWLADGVDFPLFSRRIEFIRSALDNDLVRISRRPTALSGDGIVWRTEIHLIPGDELLITDESARQFTRKGIPQSLPDDLRLALMAQTQEGEQASGI